MGLSSPGIDYPSSTSRTVYSTTEALAQSISRDETPILITSTSTPLLSALIGSQNSPEPSLSSSQLHDFPSSQSPEAFQHPANRKLKCRSCSRVFKSQNKFRRHVETYEHKYKCNALSCQWSFQAPKDLRRHLLKHEANRQTYFCSYPECDYGRGVQELSFSRVDLRDRHERRTHER